VEAGGKGDGMIGQQNEAEKRLGQSKGETVVSGNPKRARTLDPTLVLNAGTVHRGPHSLNFLFSHSLNGKGEFEIRGGPTNHIIGFFHSGLSRNQDESVL
jgi:hypothetical protein